MMCNCVRHMINTVQWKILQGLIFVDMHERASRCTYKCVYFVGLIFMDSVLPAKSAKIGPLECFLLYMYYGNIFIFLFFVQPTALNSDHSESSQFGLTGMQLSVNFLFHTYFRTRKKLRQLLILSVEMYLDSLCINRSDMEYWIRNVEQLLRFCQSASIWLMELLTSQKGSNYIK